MSGINKKQLLVSLVIVFLSCFLAKTVFAKESSLKANRNNKAVRGKIARRSANFKRPSFSMHFNSRIFSRPSANFNRPSFKIGSKKREFSRPSFNISSHKGKFSMLSFSLASNKKEFSKPSFAASLKGKIRKK